MSSQTSAIRSFMVVAGQSDSSDFSPSRRTNSASAALATAEFEASLNQRDTPDGEVQARLRAIPGVESVERQDVDPDNPGFSTWRLRCATGTTPVPTLVDEAQQAGWAVAAAGPRRHTLEGFFEALHDAHIAERTKPGSNAAGALR